jgi:branched-chain amino acid transport system substrate-binding protein
MKKGSLFFLFLLSFIQMMTLGNASASGDVIKIAAIFPQSGEAMQNSIEHLVTVKVAVDEINASGGILGRQILLLELDNKSSALGARQAAHIAVKEKVVAVLGGSWSSHALGMAPVLQKAGIPMVTPTATNPKVTLTGDCIFRVCYVDEFQAKMAAKFLEEDLKVGKVAVLTNTDQIFSIELSQFFIDEFKMLGKMVTAELDYIETVPTFKGIVDELQNYEFEALFIPGYTRDSAQIIKTLREMGIKVPVLGGDGWSHRMLNYASWELDDTYYITHWYKELEDEKSKAFVKKILPFFEYSKINAGMALSYDAVYLLADAINRAGVAEPDSIRDALAATEHFEAVTGMISFDTNRNPLKPAVIITFENNKTKVVRQIAF